MSCNQLGLMRRLAVESPQTLGGEAWKAHLLDCPECRGERDGLERSLAIYRQLEHKFLETIPEAPGWEQFSRRLEQRGATQRKTRRGMALMAASVAASVSLVALGGALMAHRPDSSAPSPARIVRVSQAQREHLIRSLQGVLVEKSMAKKAGLASKQAVAAESTRQSPASGLAQSPMVESSDSQVIPVIYPRSPTVSATFVSSQVRAMEESRNLSPGGTGFTTFPQSIYSPVFPR